MADTCEDCGALRGPGDNRCPGPRTLGCNIMLVRRLRSELAAAKEELADYEQLVSDACPLGWVAAVDLDGAKAWEVRAADMLAKRAKWLSLKGGEGRES